MLFNLGVNFVLSAIKEAVKNPAKKEALRAKLLEVANAIIAVYGAESFGLKKAE